MSSFKMHRETLFVAGGVNSHLAPVSMALLCGISS